jgi:oxalyl-CoA decarboxylase
MLSALRPGSIQPDRAWLEELGAKKKQNVAKMHAHLAADAVPMNFYGALGAVRNVLAGRKGVFVVNEGANTLDFGRDILDMYEPRKRLDCGTWGVMGVGMGYAIAAAVETGRPVVAVSGDSAFGFSGMEIETICRYKLPIAVLVFNNGGIYRGDGVNRASSDPSPTTLALDGRYDKLIEAFGGAGYDAKTPAELSAALTRALDSGAPALINCAIDPTAGTESGHLTNLNPKSSVAPEGPKVKGKSHG